MQQRGAPGYDFSAKPQVVHRTGQQMYRDPYKDYVKIQPQCIMNDRRVVRGNTFAALVIPVNMQPDPMLIEKQKQDEQQRQKRIQIYKKRKEEEEIRKQQEEEEEEQRRILEAENQDVWEELSDKDNEVDMNDLEPDYFIDRPPTPIFKENPKGTDQYVQVEDHELFDFDLEAEPILQVLIGKSIENAQIEVIEEWEGSELNKHKKNFLQIKEAELLETQRVEAARKRRIEETERRNLQQRTSKNQRAWAEKKIVARLISKDLMKHFRRDTFNQLEDQGILRDPRQYSMAFHFMPSLFNQVESELGVKRETTDTNDNLLALAMRQQCKSHKEAIHNEYKRRDEKRKEEFRIQKEKEEEKRRQREERAAARERLRVSNLKEEIHEHIQKTAQVEETFNPQSMRIFDIRDPDANNSGVFLIGGLTGELLITFTCLYDYILANPQNQNFSFTSETLEIYLKELLFDGAFLDGALTLHVKSFPTNQSEAPAGEAPADGEEAPPAEEEKKQESAGIPDGTDIESLLRHCLTIGNISDFGLAFFFEVVKELVINRDFIEALYKTIINVSTRKLEIIEELPEAPQPTEEGAEVPDEDKKAWEKRCEEIKTKNAENEKVNEEVTKIQSKIRIKKREVDWEENNEIAVVKLSNFREPAPEQNEGEERKDTDQAEGDESAKNTDRQINFEEIPSKLMLLNPRTDRHDLIVFHSEPQIALRKLMIELAKKHFKELEKLNMQSVMNHIIEKTQQLENKFMDNVNRTFKYKKFDQAKNITLPVPVPVFEFENNL